MRTALRRHVVVVLTVLGAIALVAGLVVVLGLIPIRASSGHWKATHHLLEFVKRRSVSTQALGTRLPSSNDRGLVLYGAAIYESNCRMCHGSPGTSMPIVPGALLPKPPDLVNIVPTYEPEELFVIVKHGIKFTGMPAWPTQQRDDEVHAIVAFLRELPKLSTAQYQALAFGEPAQVGDTIGNADAFDSALDARAGAPPLTAKCARCHGPTGNGRGAGLLPKIAGQKPAYLFNALNAYADGKRPSGVMAPAAAALNEQERRALSEYYAKLSAEAYAAPLADEGAVERGAVIAARGDAARGIPPCKECHGPAPHARNAAYPNLAGQHLEYLRLQLQLFNRGARGGSAYAHLMRHVASRLSTEQMNDVAAYYATLRPEDRND